MDVNTPTLIDFTSVSYTVKTRAMVKKMPGFFFSSYR